MERAFIELKAQSTEGNEKNEEEMFQEKRLAEITSYETPLKHVQTSMQIQGE